MLTYRKYLLFCIGLILSFQSALASHAANGGQLYWECHNGKYVFYFENYFVCTGLTYTYQDRILKISGNPLPRDASNAIVDSIILKADSVRYLQALNGFTHLRCIQGNDSIGCFNSVYSFKRYFYKSDSLELVGTPPNTGWLFEVNYPDSRSTQNISSSGTGTLTARLYPDANSSNSSSCYEIPPRFAEHPQFHFCKGIENQFAIKAIDSQDDSLVYRLAPALVVSGSSRISANYRSGYSFNNPLPNQTTDTANRGLLLNRMNGEATFKVASSMNDGHYTIRVSVDSYREGKLISTVDYESPIGVFSCPNLPNSVMNKSPRLQPPFTHSLTNQNLKDTVIVGSPSIINLSILDTNTFNGQLQNIRVEIHGNRLSKQMVGTTDCPIEGDTTCGRVSFNPSYDAVRNTFYFTSLASWNASIFWQTDCADLGRNGEARTHYFYIRMADDHCPNPADRTEIISITVLPDTANCPNLISSIDQFESDQSLKLFPNPTNGLVFIDGLDQSFDYQIFNIQGKLMRRGRIDQHQNQLELPKAEGLYFVSFRDANGHEKTFKLVKQD